MFKNAKIIRWLVPVCLFILLFILLLAINYTSASTSTPDPHIVATAVSEVNQTVTAQSRNPLLEKPVKKITPTPTVRPVPTSEPTKPQNHPTPAPTPTPIPVIQTPTFIPNQPTPITTPPHISVG